MEPSVKSKLSRIVAFMGLAFLASLSFAQTAKREDYCINLVGVGIDSRLTLSRRIALPVIGTADPDEFLGEKPLVEGMHSSRGVSLNSIDLRSLIFLLSSLRSSN